MAKSDLQVLSVSEEEHARKQTQMHNLATNITDQMAKKINSEFGETFTYNKTYFGKTEGLNYACLEVVIIEQFSEGGPLGMQAGANFHIKSFFCLF